MPDVTRHFLGLALILVPLSSLPAQQASSTSSSEPSNPHENSISIVDTGAVGDGTTLNTQPIQTAIDRVAGKGGGIVVIPSGVFVSGAIFLKPGVDLLLQKDAVLKCSTDMTNFPEQRTRIEGHFEDHFNPALINADGCDHLRITGEGTLDGDGRPLWDLFWKLRGEAKDKKNFKNLGVPRARLCLIENSKDVVIDGITFKDSQYWNLHLYKCTQVAVQSARFQVPDDYKQAPSTDGIDVDSCQDITIKSCYFSVTDDCIAMKGSKGPHALDDKDSPPDENIHVSDCTFKRGVSVVTLGSEATIVRHVVAENCRVSGSVAIACLKLRSDTPQDYEDIHYSTITIDGTGAIIELEPWTQYTDLQGQEPPKSVVRNVTLSGIRGKCGSLGIIEGNRGQTDISNINLQNIDVLAKKPKLKTTEAASIRMDNVSVNGQPSTP